MIMRKIAVTITAKPFNRDLGRSPTVDLHTTVQFIENGGRQAQRHGATTWGVPMLRIRSATVTGGRVRVRF